MAEFPDLLINPNPNAPTLDASGNQVRGINIFDTTAERDALNATVRIPGALAVIKGSDELYQYTAETVDDTAWQDEANWLGVGSAGGSGVQNVNNLNGNVTLIAGDGIEIDVITGNNEIEITSTGGGGGSTTGIDLSLIVRETAYASVGDHEGTVLTIGPVGALAQVHRWNGTGWTLANGSSVADSSGLLCLGTAASGDALVKGIMQLVTVPGSAGDVLYMSTTNGLLTNDVSGFTQGQIVRVCGYNLGGNRVYFNPSADWIELA